jgi:hypothetical protein
VTDGEREIVVEIPDEDASAAAAEPPTTSETH